MIHKVGKIFKQTRRTQAGTLRRLHAINVKHYGAPFPSPLHSLRSIPKAVILMQSSQIKETKEVEGSAVNIVLRFRETKGHVLSAAQHKSDYASRNICT